MISPEEAFSRFVRRWALLLEEGLGPWIACIGFLMMVFAVIAVSNAS